MLSLTPSALHSLHSICSGGVSASLGALGLFRLDVCMCQQGGEFLGEVIKQFLGEVIEQGGDLFDFGFESASFWENCTCEGKCISGGVSALVVAPVFIIFPLLLA